MPVIINNPDVSNLLVVGPTSKAIRTTHYNSVGDADTQFSLNYPASGGSFIAPIEFRSTTGIGTTVASVAINPVGNNRSAIRAIRGFLSFDGTGLSASVFQRIGLYRGRGWHGGLGGVVHKSNPNKEFADTGGSSSIVRQVLAGTTLTVTDLVFEVDAFHVFAIPSQATQVAVVTTSGSTGTSLQLNLDFRDSPIILGQGEVLAFRGQTATDIIGLGFCGSIDWAEY
jgi:hypothetical protein